MKKFSVFLCAVALVFGVAGNVWATPFTFSGSDNGGTGSATMYISILGNTLTATLYNTSPTTLDVGNGINSPGITAFGFDLDPDSLILTSWELKAYSSGGSEVTIGKGVTDTWDWGLTTIGGNVNGIKVDYAPNTSNGVKGAIYNPDISSGQGAAPNYYSQATLTLNFDAVPSLNTTDADSPFVRMQNVGLNGEGSLKLHVQEPATLFLLGSGLIGLAVFGRRKLFKKS